MGKHEQRVIAVVPTMVQKYIVPILIGSLTIISYYASLFYGFMFDDYPTIIHYFHVRFFDPIGMFFANPRWISRVLNQFTYHYWNDNAFAYRIIDLAIQLAIGYMIFYMLLDLLPKFKKSDFIKQNAYLISLLTAGLFLLHPVQTQTATYITQMRLEGLVVLFAFLVLTTFVKALRSANQSLRIGWFAVSYIFTAFAAGTKEIVVALPFLIVLVDWFFVAQGEWEDFKTRLWIHAGYFGVLFGTLIYMGIRPEYVSRVASTPVRNNRGNLLTEHSDVYISMFPYFISQFKVIWHYISIFVLPFRVCFDYDMRFARSIFALDVIVPAVSLFGLTLFTLKRWIYNKADLWSFSFAWFMISILPRASIIPSTELICDYKTYLSSFGALFAIALAFVWCIDFLIEKMKGLEMNFDKQLTQIVVGFFVLSCAGIATNERNKVWSSELAFWQDAVDGAPTKARSRNNLATAKYENGDKQGAIDEFNRAIECDGNYGEPHVNLASIYQMAGDYDRALTHYSRALEIGEGHPEMFHNLGMLHLSQNNNDVAAECFRQAIDLKPYYSSALRYLGKLSQAKGDQEAAMQYFDRAINGDMPDNECFYLKGTLLIEQGKFAEAIKTLEKVGNGYLDVEFQLGYAYYSLNQYDVASEFFERSCERDQNNLVYVHNYAQALINAGHYSRALVMFEKCLELSEPGALPFLPMHIAKCKFFVGKKDEATKEMHKLLESSQDAVRNDVRQFLQEHGLA